MSCKAPTTDQAKMRMEERGGHIGFLEKCIDLATFLFIQRVVTVVACQQSSPANQTGLATLLLRNYLELYFSASDWLNTAALQR
jgi:hypothetical protein